MIEVYRDPTACQWIIEYDSEKVYVLDRDAKSAAKVLWKRLHEGYMREKQAMSDSRQQ